MRVKSEKTLDLFRGPGACALCLRWFDRLEAHHTFIKRGMGGGTRLDLPENLAGLCPPCHHKVEHSQASARLVQVEVVNRVVPGNRTSRSGIRFVTVGDFREWLDLVLRTPKEKGLPPKPWEASDAQEGEGGSAHPQHRGGGIDGGTVLDAVPPLGPDHRRPRLAVEEDSAGWLSRGES